ncbi:GxxExxY protein [Geothrix sp. PMB-07]|uniref:GxxExxY protein n=1 Tax=Geothrix sp. PMB-07 TaxID=3068640 RepID=UPI0027420F5D|nr:GxxExxY protein [Geothrix sp. PMB-07]WLT31262.1 GxxExxY protein [Geothrix sp. PMB-07]
MHGELIHGEITEKVLGAAIEVHKHLGPGLLESTYEACLCHELEIRGLSFQRQLQLPLDYKGLRVDAAFRLDLVVEGKIIVELKSQAGVLPVHEAQLMTYMKLAGMRVGLLLNFNVTTMKDGIIRRVL